MSLKIQFTGTSPVLSMLQSLLDGFAEFKVTADCDLLLYEISSQSDFNNISHSATKPVYLLVTAKDSTLIEKIRGMKVSGIFTPPFNKDTFIKKLSKYSYPNNLHSANTSNYDMVKVKVLAKAESMPALPVFAQKLLALTSSNDSSMQEMIAQIKHDQGIAGRVIKMINSPFFGIKKEITNIDMAAVYLGIETLRNIALTTAMGSYYGKGFHVYGISGSKLWEHSYKVALCCQETAKACNIASEPYFLAGLIHDIGKTILVDFLVNKVSNVNDEHEQLGIDHPVAASMILKKWQVSGEIIDMVKNHHHPDNKLSNYVLYYINRLSHYAIDSEEYINDENLLFDLLPQADKQNLSKTLKGIIAPEIQEFGNTI